MRDTLIGACVRLIEARLKFIGDAGMGTPQGACSACLQSPLGRSGWWRLGARVLAGLTSPHGKKNASCGDRGQ